MDGILGILKELESITKFEDSEDELNLRTDKLIGAMSDDLKKWYTLLWRARRKAIEARQKMPQPDESVTCLACQAHAAFHRADLIREIFLCAVRDCYDLWGNGCPAIGVRKGFLIVVSATGKKQTWAGATIVQVAMKTSDHEFPGPVCNN
ncbi:MAG: hypothetical protein HY443_00680 [Candidatus Nealsonbacteria bacterium]|nr:hypothetical protein [Candidatus Nealsonbacteria bacterium]